MKYVLFAFVLFLQHFVSAQNKTIPGKLAAPYPTIENLAVEWYISGDENLNGVVTVQYRKKGETSWQEAMPLRRVPAGENLNTTTLPKNNSLYTRFNWLNKHSGSVFNLQPATRYEIKLSLKDPDGGSAVKMIEASTRPIPAINANAEIVEIKPGIYDTLRVKNGNRQHPVVYRCKTGKAIFKYIDLTNKKWVYLDGLEVRNTEGGEEAVAIGMNGAENCSVTYCTINAVYGIVADVPGVTNCYFSDNTITGVCEWTAESFGADGKNVGEGIQVTGSGNVICYNKVSNFRDCISTMEDDRASKQICVDIYNNDIYQGLDDGIEADFCFSNCRIVRNRLTDCYVGLSSQPSLGGPTYFIRNAMYNVIHSAFKLKRFSKGDVVLHNTVVKVGVGLGGNSQLDYAFFRNNLAFGGTSGGVLWGGYGSGNSYAADIIEPGTHCSFDYDAVGSFDTAYVGLVGALPFLQVEKHGIGALSFQETFAGLKLPQPMLLSEAAPDLRPLAHSRTIDAAQVIPNINDHFKGKAPDCGAYEAGEEFPHYGPRARN
ncbi:MAG: right-handed parallel beta-helix repeat-containing protein [Flavitalea sp.]